MGKSQTRALALEWGSLSWSAPGRGSILSDSIGSKPEIELLFPIFPSPQPSALKNF